MNAKTGSYYWIKLKDDRYSIWEPAYRFRSTKGKDVWLVIATAEDIDDDRVETVGSELRPPSVG